MSDFQQGQQVRFRLGERVPFNMPCCGMEVDQWQVMVDVELTQGVFNILMILGDGDFYCPDCGADLDKNYGYPPIRLSHRFRYQERNYDMFGAYPEDLELVGD